MSQFNLTKEQKVLLNLISLNVNGNANELVLSDQEIDGVNWEEVAKESIVQSVPLCALDACAVYKKVIPENIFAKWSAYSMRVMQSNMKVINSQQELINILGEKHPYLILKGTSACSYYNKPILRALGDVDFLIEPKQQSEIEKLLIDNGCTLSGGDHPNHVVFKKPGAHLEMHFEVAGVPYGKVGELVKEFLKDAVYAPVKKSYESCEFNAPTDLNHALILLLHMQHHMLGEGFGLRHLSDWTVFVNKTHNEAFWQEKLLPFLKKIGLYNYAKIMTKVGAVYLNSILPAWAKDADDDVCAQIINDILMGGNFGRKDENRSSSGMLISEHGKGGTKHGAVYNLAHGLHKAVLRKKAVKKCILLYPFVYVYKAIRFVFLSIIGKRPSIVKMLPEAEKRKVIYDKLAIFETDLQEK